MFPLSTVLFPHAELPLHVFEPRYRALMADCLAGDGTFGVVLIARGSEVGGGDERVDVGTVARIDQVTELDDGRMLVTARGVSPDRGWTGGSPRARTPGRRCEDLPARVRRPATGRRWPPPRARSADCGRSSPSWGTSPPCPTTSRSAGDDEEVGWRLCELAPLNLIDRQRLLARAGAGRADGAPVRAVRRPWPRTWSCCRAVRADPDRSTGPGAGGGG